jgi:hypothetical protein
MKRIVSITCVLMLLFPAIFGAQFITHVTANPIPIPALIMEAEYIDATISQGDQGLYAQVEGKYIFFNAGYDTVSMDYPVPPDAENITVTMCEDVGIPFIPVDWAINNKTYPTVIGDFSMINWTISIQDMLYFTVGTHYEHNIQRIGGNCTFLYAMGTGRYLETYAKETVAYIHIYMEVNYTNLHAYTVGIKNGAWTWKPANYTVTKIDTTDIITLTITSELFQPLIEDLLITFTVTPPPHDPWDINIDGKVDMKDIGAAAKAFGSSPGHPRWSPWADITGPVYLVPDEKVDLRDIALIAKHYGE